MTETALQPRTDYFYCDECSKHVACVRVQPGVWEIQCPNCVGECALCSCHLAKYCFGNGNEPRMVVVTTRANEARQPLKK